MPQSPPETSPSPAADPVSWTRQLAGGLSLPATTFPDPRTAFALHASELINHYGPIWERLDPASFHVVQAAEDPEENRRIAAFAARHGYTTSFIADVFVEGRRFDAVVSNHAGSAGPFDLRGSSCLRRLGGLQVRLMYALGKEGWQFAGWNELYDLILCWGPYQAGRLADFERPRVLQVGYPRFDRFFRISEPRRDVVARLGGDPDRPTLAWMPTWSTQSSIDDFVETIAALRDEVNVITKVHPITAGTEPSRMARLAAAGLANVGGPDFDNVELFYAADIVAADFGSSAFGAIYADRDVVLLNTPAIMARPDNLVGRDSLDRRIREWVLNIDPGEGAQILEYLRDPAAREQQRGVRERLRRSLFAPFHGCAADVAATAIRNAAAICA